MTGVSPITGVKNGACSSCYTYNALRNNQNSHLLLPLSNRILDPLKYIGFYQFTQFMNAGRFINSLPIHCHVAVVCTKSVMWDGFLPCSLQHVNVSYFNHKSVQANCRMQHDSSASATSTVFVVSSALRGELSGVTLDWSGMTTMNIMDWEKIRGRMAKGSALMKSNWSPSTSRIFIIARPEMPKVWRRSPLERHIPWYQPWAKWYQFQIGEIWIWLECPPMVFTCGGTSQTLLPRSLPVERQNLSGWRLKYGR